MKKALIAMSGGVDSSVAAFLTLHSGYDCVGATMRLHREDPTASEDNGCCTSRDIEDARAIANRLVIPFSAVDFFGDFEKQVVCPFVQAYEQGRTPNPCVDCNRTLKFEKLFEYGQELGCDFIVTGHYARIEQAEDGSFVLKKGLDDSKDQSYVLYNLTQQQLAHTRFPLGGISKEEVRRIAEEQGFNNARKKDSQDICFVPDGDYAAFLERHTGKTYLPGDFVDTDGNVLGRHQGIIRYTIGQRKGLGISAPHPLYVQKICPENNTVVLGGNETLFAREVIADRVNIISGHPWESKRRLSARIRYKHKEQPGAAWLDDDGLLHMLFDEPQRAATPGQSLVLYDGDIVVGGGTIV